MDQSIQNTREKDKQIWEQELCLYEVMNETSNLDRKDPRGVLFRRLMNEDLIFKNYFENLLSEVLNHRLPYAYIESKVKYYEKMGLRFDYNQLMRFAKTSFNLPDMAFFTEIGKEDYLTRIF